MFDGLTVLTKVPKPIVAALRSKAIADIAFAVVQEEHYQDAGATRRALNDASSRIGNAVPSLATISKARERREPVKIGNRAHWPLGWRHWHIGAAEVASAEPGLVEALRSVVANALVLMRRQPKEAQSVDQGTGIITELLRDWAHRAKIGKPFAELGLPVIGAGSEGGYGRLDLVLLRAGTPDVAIEIDSQHNPNSLAKLDFARDAGAIPIWIRWHEGRVAEHDGLLVLDFVSKSRTE